MIQFDNAVERYNKIILAELKDAGIDCWIAGGALRDYFMGVPIKSDYDIFFPDETNNIKAKSFFQEKEGAKIIWSSEHGTKVSYKGKKYDLIQHYFPSPAHTINEFDFTVSMIAVDCEKVYHGDTTFIDLSKRQLMINKITYPASTMSRAFRYYRKGFYMCQGEMTKLLKAIQKMTPEPDTEDEDESDNQSSYSRIFIGFD